MDDRAYAKIYRERIAPDVWAWRWVEVDLDGEVIGDPSWPPRATKRECEQEAASGDYVVLAA